MFCYWYKKAQNLNVNKILYVDGVALRTYPSQNYNKTRKELPDMRTGSVDLFECVFIDRKAWMVERCLHEFFFCTSNMHLTTQHIIIIFGVMNLYDFTWQTIKNLLCWFHGQSTSYSLSAMFRNREVFFNIKTILSIELCWKN